jgi:hypothetical protein
MIQIDSRQACELQPWFSEINTLPPGLPWFSNYDLLEPASNWVPDAQKGSASCRWSAADVDQGETLEINTIVVLAKGDPCINDSHCWRLTINLEILQADYVPMPHDNQSFGRKRWKATVNSLFCSRNCLGNCFSNLCFQI